MWTSLKEPFIVFVEDCEYCLVEIRLTVLGCCFFCLFVSFCFVVFVCTPKILIANLSNFQM